MSPAAVRAARPSTRAVVRPDAVAAAAVDAARGAAVAVGGDTVGEHVGVRAEAERLVTHAFAASLPGYAGWQWSVTVARAPRAKVVTIDEVVLLPSDGALLAPQWVPWNERIRAGDLGPGDLLPVDNDDPRLVPAYVDLAESSSPVEAAQQERVAFELALGRERVMSRFGRSDAAERWAFGDGGPDTPMARQAPGPCSTCGFFLSLAGSLSAYLGVCGNEFTETDGRVVTVDHGCGAHSEAAARVSVESQVPLPELVFDDGEIFDSAPTPVG